MSEEAKNRTPWVQIRVNLPRHRKTLKLARLIDESRQAACGIVIELFSETYLNEWQTGDWKNWHPGDLEQKLGWVGETGVLVKALQEAGFLDGMAVHDWNSSQSRKISDRQRGVEPAPRRQHGQTEADPNAARDKTRRLLEDRAKEKSR